jgi:thiamine pyrophosphokinase-like protein
VLFTLAGLAAIAVAIAVSPALRHVFEYLSERLLDLLGLG